MSSTLHFNGQPAPHNKKPRLTKAEMLARARKPLWRVPMPDSTVNQPPSTSEWMPSSKTIDTPSLPPSLKSILNATLEDCIARDLEDVHSERRKLRTENRSLQSECAQVKYERDTAFAELQNLTGDLRRGSKRKSWDDEPCIKDDREYFDFVKPAGPGVCHRTSPPVDRQPSPPLPKLQLSHVQAMYGQFNDRVYCRVCLMRNSGGQPSRPSKSFPACRLSLDDLVFHCVFEHPMTYSEITGLTVDQVKEIQRRLSPLAY